MSFRCGADGRGRSQRSKVVRGPISEHSLAIDELPRNGTKHARVVRAVAMIAHYKVSVRGNAVWRVRRTVQVARRNILVGQFMVVDVNMAVANLDGFTRKSHHALDERFRAVQRIPENDHVAALDGLEMVHKFVDENTLLIAEQRIHAGAFDLDRLVKENHHHDGEPESDGQIARPTAQFTPQRRRLLRWLRGICRAGNGRVVHESRYIYLY